MANVIILIHGLGNKPSNATLEKWWKQAMIEGLKKSNFKTLLPKIEMVYWADVMHEVPLNEKIDDPENPAFLDERYTKGSKNFKVENHETRKKVIDFLNRQMKKIFLNEDSSLNYKYITDSIVSSYFKDLEIYYNDKCADEKPNDCLARVIIRKRLLAKLEEHKNDEIMLISHSMGSIIAFDTLSFLASHININTFVTMGSPLGLPIVISKISAEHKRNNNNDKVLKTPSNIKNNWYNFSDISDKVAFNFRLDDDYHENNNGIKPIDFLVVNNYEMNGEPNPHKSYGYLRTSEFSAVLNDFINSEKLTIKELLTRKTKNMINSLKTKLPWIGVK